MSCTDRNLCQDTCFLIGSYKQDFANQKSNISGQYEAFERCKNRHDYTSYINLKYAYRYVRIPYAAAIPPVGHLGSLIAANWVSFDFMFLTPLAEVTLQ